jgi:hypothetical protein
LLWFLAAHHKGTVQLRRPFRWILPEIFHVEQNENCGRPKVRTASRSARPTAATVQQFSPGLAVAFRKAFQVSGFGFRVGLIVLAPAVNLKPETRNLRPVKLETPIFDFVIVPRGTK